jgi:ABC-2 type transport system ATP-binding protein
MKILTGSLNPSSGRATVGGHDVLEDAVSVRRVLGYLPENTPLYEDMSVKEYLGFCGRLRGMRGSHLAERIDMVVAQTALQPKFRAVIKTLSKGYRQRVGVAQALLHEPEIIILDEPTVGLDPNQVVDVRNLIREVGEDRTVILCSHILSEVEATCGRVVIIHEGQIVAAGTPAGLEETLGQQRYYEVGARGDAAAVQGIVAALPGVGGATCIGDSGSEVCIRFEASKDDPVAERIAEALRGAGIELRSIQRRRASLEEVFRHHTAGEEAVA